jgi:ABC-2 type transport system ATP-binding protein
MQLNVLEIESIEISFGALKAIDKLSLQIPQGCIFGLIGPNGAGKTTTINCISDLIDYDSGVVKIFGKNLSDEGLYIKNKMGILYENTEDLFLYLTGEEYLEFTGEVYGLDKNIIKERINIVLDYLELDLYRFMLIDEYSKGMKKKIALASILLHNPDLIILDEPFDGLDALTVIKLKKLFIQLKEKGKTVLVTSHILSYIEDVTDEVAIINKGKIVYQSRTGDIRKKIKNEVSQETYQTLEEVFIDIVSEGEANKVKTLPWL